MKVGPSVFLAHSEFFTGNLARLLLGEKEGQRSDISRDPAQNEVEDSGYNTEYVIVSCPSIMAFN